MAEDDSTGKPPKARKTRVPERARRPAEPAAELLADINDRALRERLATLAETVEGVDRRTPAVEELEPAARERLGVPFAQDNPGLPNAILRAALFPVLPPNGERPFVKKAPIFSVAGLKVTFTGQRFDQSDLDVLLGVFDIGKYQPLGHKLEFAAHALLKLLGKTTGGTDHEWLHSVLTRLTGGIIDIRYNQKRFFGALLLGGVRDEITGRYTIAINADLAVMFGFGMWSYVEREQRSALGRNQTAKVFHLYYSSHAAPGKHSYETLAALADLQNKQKADVKRNILRAHDALKAPDCGFLVDYQADKDGVLVTKRDTPSQLRHLAAKGTSCATRRRKPRESKDAQSATAHGMAATPARDSSHN